MDKYTKAVLTVITLCVLALPVKADEIIDCGGILYRLERNLFSANTVPLGSMCLFWEGLRKEEATVYVAFSFSIAVVTQ